MTLPTIISKADRSGGGASKCADLLAGGLGEVGYPVNFLRMYDSQLPNPLGDLAIQNRISRRIVNGIHKASRRYLGGEWLPLEIPFLKHNMINGGIVHFYDTWTAISPFSWLWSARQRPTVITFQDCSAFTGGCMYPHPCRRFERDCGMCPQQDSLGMPIDVTSYSQRLRRKVMAGLKADIVTPSAWMRDMAQASGVFPQCNFHVIPNPVDTSVFHRDGRKASRKVLDIDPTRKTVLIGAESVDDPRKGVRLAIQSINALPEEINPLVLCVGRNTGFLTERLKFPVHSFGFVSDQEQLAEIYRAADVFLFCSRVDNSPLSVIESMACGTPVIADPTGGTGELIDHGFNGWHVTGRSPENFACCIREALSCGRDLHKVGNRASETAFARNRLDLVAQAHVKLYNLLLCNSHADPKL